MVAGRLKPLPNKGERRKMCLLLNLFALHAYKSEPLYDMETGVSKCSVKRSHAIEIDAGLCYLPKVQPLQYTGTMSSFQTSKRKKIPRFMDGSTSEFVRRICEKH